MEAGLDVVISGGLTIVVVTTEESCWASKEGWEGVGDEEFGFPDPVG